MTEYKIKDRIFIKKQDLFNLIEADLLKEKSKQISILDIKFPTDATFIELEYTE